MCFLASHDEGTLFAEYVIVLGYQFSREYEFREVLVNLLEFPVFDKIDLAVFKGLYTFKGGDLFEKTFYGDHNVIFFHEPGRDVGIMDIVEAPEQTCFQKSDLV